MKNRTWGEWNRGTGLRDLKKKGMGGDEIVISDKTTENFFFYYFGIINLWLHEEHDVY